MPQDQESGRAGRDFGVKANADAANKFPHLTRDLNESTVQKTVLNDVHSRTYWLKNGRSTPTMSDRCLGRLHCVLIEDDGGDFYAMRCSEVVNHANATPSKSSGHGPKNLHTRLAIEHVRTSGLKIDPTTFVGIP